MKIEIARLPSYFAVAFALCGALELNAQPTAFTYQGRLNDGGNPANGIYDLQFTIFDAASGVGVQDGPLTNAPTTVSDGLFTVTLDFGAGVFTGADRWLEIGVRTNGSAGAYQPLAPRQPVTATPYAVLAANATSFTGAVSDGQLSANVARLNANQTFNGTVNFSSGANSFSGNFTGNGSGVTNVPGAIPVLAAAGTSVPAQPNTSYDATNAAQVNFSLPTNANVGDIVRVSGLGAGGWRVEAAGSETINGYQPGVTWIPRATERRWSSIAASADGTKVVAAAQNDQIYTSTDGGANWVARATNRNWSSVASSSDGSKLVAVAVSDQIYTSTDGGANWTARETNRYWTAVASSADGSKLVAVADSDQIYTSADGGTNWTARASIRVWTSVASSADGSKLVAVDGNEGRIYTSTDSGTNWTARESERFWNAVASSADGSKLVAVDGGFGQIYTSTDSGTNWTARETDRIWSSVASSADGSKLVAAEAGGILSVFGGQIYTSSDSGINWTARESARNWTSVASSADGNELFAVDVGFMSGGRIYTSTVGISGGQGATVELQYAGSGTWQPLNLVQSDNTANTIVFRDASGGFVAGNIAVSSLAAGGNISAAGSIAASNNISATSFTWGHGASLVNDQGGSIELGEPDGISTTPFIDFHYGIGEAQDYNVRLINDASNHLSLIGDFQVNGTVTGNSFIGSGAELTNLNAANVTGTLGDAQISDLDASKITGGTLADARLSANVAFLNATQSFSGAITLNNAANSFTGTGTGLSSLNASQLSSGTVADARLSGNVALLNASQTFSGANTLGNAANSFAGNGAGLTSLNASQLNSGTVPDARLSANVTLLDANQTFTGQNIFSNSVSGGGVTLDASSVSGAFNLRNTNGIRGSLGLATVAGNYSTHAVAGDTVLRASAGKLLIQAGAGTSAITISSSNLVGIGKTNPATLLDVGGTVTATTLGIGITNPATKLHVFGVGDTEISVQSGDSGGRRWTLQSSGINAGGLEGTLQLIDRTAGASRLLIDTNGNVGIGTSGPTNKLHVNGGVSATAFVTTSDRNAKENFAPVSPQEVLNKVAALPITTWNFKTMNDGRHMGPMAQDFHAAFGLGGGDTTITSVDPDGVALAAIQGLNEKVEDRGQKSEVRIQKLEAENAELKQSVAEVKALVSKLASERNGGAK